MADSRHITRRAAIVGIGLSAVSVAPIVAASADSYDHAAPHFDLQAWLDTAPAHARVQYHLEHLTKALRDQHGGGWRGVVLESNYGAVAVPDHTRSDGEVWIHYAGH